MSSSGWAGTSSSGTSARLLGNLRSALRAPMPASPRRYWSKSVELQGGPSDDGGGYDAASHQAHAEDEGGSGGVPGGASPGLWSLALADGAALLAPRRIAGANILLGAAIPRGRERATSTGSRAGPSEPKWLHVFGRLGSHLGRLGASCALGPSWVLGSSLGPLGGPLGRHGASSRPIGPSLRRGLPG